MDIRYISSTGGDLKGFAASLREAQPRVGAKAAQALRAGGARIERSAKINAPVDTGNLRASINTTSTGDGRRGRMTVRVGPTANYAPYVELGTSRMAPQPFLGPAVDEHEDAIIKALADAFGEALP